MPGFQGPAAAPHRRPAALARHQGKRVEIARSHRATINYTTTYAAHYLARGLTPPAAAKILVRDEAGYPVALSYTSFLEKVARGEIVQAP